MIGSLKYTLIEHNKVLLMISYTLTHSDYIFVLYLETVEAIPPRFAGTFIIPGLDSRQTKNHQSASSCQFS